MIQNALAAALVVYALLAAWLLHECAFLARYRTAIWDEYGRMLIWMSLVLILNLFAAFYGLFRKLALKDTGDKLSHLEKQLRGRTTILRELTERILQRK